jgi:phage-related minor tail protein
MSLQQQQQEVYNNLKDENNNYNKLIKKRNLEDEYKRNLEDEYERKLMVDEYERNYLLLHAQGHADTGQRAFRPRMEEYHIYRHNSYKPYEPYNATSFDSPRRRGGAGKVKVYTGPKNGKYIIKNGSKVYIDRKSISNNVQYIKKTKPKKK